ncbi:MAG: hypothetical protein CM15mP24_2370 [Candidatus Pelagibacterales bacterium]|nr:MAG: hypothetical protein CM15mP24_2370 [Pelagibacterales bacterium]
MKNIFFLNLWVDIDRFVLSWDENWRIKKKNLILKLVNILKSYEYIKNC